MADSGGGILGLAVDAAGMVYACDEGRAEVLRVDPRSGEIEVYSAGSPERPMIEPNSCAFDAAGNLYVTDSSDWEEQNGVIYRIAPGGETVVWTDALRRYPNGCCFSADGSWLYVVESSLPGIWRVPVGADGARRGAAARPRAAGGSRARRHRLRRSRRPLHRLLPARSRVPARDRAATSRCSPTTRSGSS